MIINTDYLILGGGIAGLGASIALKKRGKDSILLEAEQVPGGLNRSETLAGCGFDFGPKILILDDSENSQELLGYLEGNYLKYPMAESVWLKDHGLVGFPLQRNLIDLPKDLRTKIIDDIKFALENPRAIKSFEDWLINNFGEFFARWIMIPYEEKKWQIPLSEMEYDWALKRPIKVNLEEIIKGSQEKLLPNRNYYYPAYGRIDSLTFAMAREAGQILYGARAIHINMKDNLVETKDGRIFQYQKLISTLPLDEMINMAYFEDIYAPCYKRYEGWFRRLGIIVFNLVFEGDFDLKGSAIYFPESDYSFRRVSVLQNLCPALRRKGKTPISVEISLGEDVPAKMLDPQSILAKILTDFKKIPQFAQLERLLDWNVKPISFAYPLQVNGLGEVREEVKALFKQNEIYLCGRGGNFDYCNSDVAYLQGKELGQEL